MAVNQQRRKGRMIRVDREVDMTAPRHHKKITQMLKDERLDERKPFNAPSEYMHAKSFACYQVSNTSRPSENQFYRWNKSTDGSDAINAH